MITLIYLQTIFGIHISNYIIMLLIAIPAFFIWRYVFKKFISVIRTRKMVTWTATLISAPLIYMGIVQLFFFGLSYYPTHDFNKEKWFSDREKRYEVFEDIIESEMLIGKTKTEVRQILGDENNSDESDYWRYNIGYVPAFFCMDPTWLDIDFKNGKVIRVGQHRS